MNTCKVNVPRSQFQVYFFLKFLMASLIVLVNWTTITAQEVQLPQDSTQIIIKLNTSVKVEPLFEKNQMAKLKVIRNAKVESPLNVMEYLEQFEKDTTASSEINFKFCEGDMMGSPIIVLTTIHHLRSTLSFKAKIRYKGETDFVETTVVPATPHAVAIEQWRDEIDAILLYEFEVKNP